MTTRTPDEIMRDFDLAVKGQADIDPHDILWEIIEDIQDSYHLAMMTSSYMPGHYRKTVADEIKKEVSDYISNHYGD